MLILGSKRHSWQPPQGAQINYGHPLASGLLFYILYNAGGGSPRCLKPAANTPTLVGSAASPLWTTGPGGRTVNWNSSFSYWLERASFCEPNWITVVSRGQRTGALTQSALTIAKTFHNGGSAPFISYGMPGNPGGANSDQFLCQFSGSDGNLHNGNTISKTLTVEHTMGMTVGPSGSSAVLKSYFNGIVQDTSTFATISGLSYDTTSTGRLLLSGNSAAAATNEWNGKVYYSAIWNRPLSAAEMEWLHADPYALLVQPKTRTWSVPSNLRLFSYWIILERLS